MKKAAMVTVDAATIYFSGGAAIAGSVSKARRLWLLSEVGGAIGNIGINTGVIFDTSWLGKATNIYNAAMVVVGAKNIGKGIINFSKSLPDNVRTLLSANKSIRDLLVAKYAEWTIATKNLDNLSDVERQLIEKQKQVWKLLGVVEVVQSEDDFLTIGTQVKRARNKSSLFNSFTDNTKVPSIYLTNENRFNTLATDPDQGLTIKVSTRKEAMAGLEAEHQNIVSNLERGPKGIEFYDANRTPWDVKTPFGDYFDVKQVGGAIKKELTESKTIEGIVHPAGKFIDPISGQIKFKKILLDCTYINDIQLTELRGWLKNQSGLSLDELNRIIEINIHLP